MAKFIKTNSSGKIEICIRKYQEKPNQDYISRKYSQSYINREFGPDSWIKVVFNDGANFDCEWIRQELQKAASESVLKIFNYRVTEESAILFIKLTNISFASFKSNCKKIPHPHSGQPCDVIVLSTENPETPSTIPRKWTEVLKETLSQRYNSTDQSLDLSNFTSDSHLQSRGLWLPLSRPAVFREITSLLQSIDNFTLNSINLSNNGLLYTTPMIPLFESVPIKKLDLSANCLIVKSLLRSLNSAVHLTDLIVENDRGTLGQRIKQPAASSSFVIDLVENCPSLERFNRENVTNSAELFAGGVVTTRLMLPPSKKPPFSETQQLVVNFFQEHAQRLETNRDELIDYYSSDSVLTLSACYHDIAMTNRRLSEVYLRNNRNLDRLKDETRRSQLIKRGSAQILGFLSEIPRLKHIGESFVVDCIVNEDRSKMFVVNGVFVECLKIPNRSSGMTTTTTTRNVIGGENCTDDKNSCYVWTGNNANSSNIGSNQYQNNSSGSNAASSNGTGTGGTHNIFNMRLFSRVMIVVPPGKILQENWTITNPTDFLFRKYRDRFEEIKNAFDSEKLQQTMAKSTEDSFSNTTVANSVVTRTNLIVSKPINDTLLVDSFRQFSKMNAFYCQQCLSESNWDFDKAKQIFQMAFNNGKIPQEAFQN